MTPETLTRTVEDSLAGARDAVVTDEGAVLFDLAQAIVFAGAGIFCRGSRHDRRTDGDAGGKISSG